MVVLRRVKVLVEGVDESFLVVVVVVIVEIFRLGEC